MLAAYRDQENRTHNCHVSTKQQPKTPGAHNPKTPARFRHDENAQTIGKKGLGAGVSQDKAQQMGDKMAVRTPYAQPRTVLGNKTTNAKAGFTGGAKQLGKDSEKTQTKRTTVQQPRQRAAQIAPIAFSVKEDPGEGDDLIPEYAPPPVASLPYESDVLPRDLSLEALKPKNLLRGYHRHYHNPLDSQGRSRSDRKLEAEMDKLVQKATEDNQRDLQDLEEIICQPRPAPGNRSRAPSRNQGNARFGSRSQPRALNTQEAATRLSRPTLSKTATSRNAAGAASSTRRPLSSLSGTRSSANKVRSSRNPSGATSTGQKMAPRTTLSQDKNKTGSTIVRSAPRLESPQLTQESRPVSARQPNVLAIFDIESEDENTTTQLKGLEVADDEVTDDEEFELKLVL